MATVPRVLWALALCVALAAVLGRALVATVPDVLDTPIVTPEPGSAARAVPLLETAGPQPPVYILRLRIDEPLALLSHPEIRVLFATYGRRARLTDATLEVEGTGCTYATPVASRLLNNRLLPFVRQGACDSPGDQPTGGLNLTVRLAERARVAIWTFMPASDHETSGRELRVVASPRLPGPLPLLRGRYVDHLPATNTRRVDLLNYVWRLSDRPTWIWAAVFTAALLVGLGVLLLTGRQSASGQVATAAVGTACMAGALGLLYAVLVPPFQAPDEPDHLLSYAQLTENLQLPVEAAAWARLGHLERIKFDSEEHFRPVDVGRPFSIAWDADIFAEDVQSRSSTTTPWWRFLSRVLERPTVPQTLLAVRLANVLLFALAVALGAGLLVWTCDRNIPYPQLLPACLLIVPTLPYFAMHMSEFAVLTSTYVLLSCVVLAMFVDGPRSSWTGLPLGLVSGMALAGGRSALPIAPLIASILLARIVLGPARSETPRAAVTQASLFWGGLTVGAAAAMLFLRPALPIPAQLRIPSFVEDAALPAFLWTWGHPWMVGVGAASAAGLEWLCSRLRGSRPESSGGYGRIATRWLAGGLAVGIGVSFVGSLLVSYPSLQVLEGAALPTAGQYVADTVIVALSFFRLGTPDYLLFTTFWAGFGWLDTFPGELFLALSTLAVGVSGVVLLAWLAARQDARRFAWFAFISAGFVATLATYALATHVSQRNLHGRYLIGPYVSMLAVMFSSVSLVGGPGRVMRSPISRPAALLAVSVGIHAYCLSLILARYF